MEFLLKSEDINTLKDNKVICDGGTFNLVEAKITFQGKGNLIYIKNPTNLDVQFFKSELMIYGNNNLVFINAGKMKYTFSLHMYHNSVCHIGANGYFNPLGEIVRLRCAEEKNIFIGNDCWFSHGIEIAVSDSHLVFSTKTLERINYAKSIYIGDHIWLGSSVSILKGSKLGSGAIVGTHSVVTGKTIPSNTCWAGSPAVQKGEDVFFVGYNAQPYQAKDIELHSTYQSDMWIYLKDENTVDFEKVENDLNALATVEEKANYLLTLNASNKKNRFFI